AMGRTHALELVRANRRASGASRVICGLPATLTKSAFERTTHYAELQSWQRLRDATEAVVNLNRAMAQGTIFLNPETHERIDMFAATLRAAYDRFREAKLWDSDNEDASDNTPIDNYRHDGNEGYQDLARYLRQRYWKQNSAD
ncbi:hypothetical protein C8J25_103364, partial [Sphingomonas faeni]